MTKAKSPIPAGFHALTPCLTVKSAKEAIEFYKKAFNAKEVSCKTGPGGKVMHAEIKIGDSVLFLNDEMPEMGVYAPEGKGGNPMRLWLYVEDVDRIFNQAEGAGARALMPVSDMFWGDRFGKLADPFGYEWELATRKEDLDDAEIEKRQKAFFAAMAGAK